MKFNLPKSAIVTLLILNTSVNVFAQTPPPSPGFDEDVNDVATTPIDNWVVPMLIVGISLLFYYYKKFQNAPSK